MLQGWRRENISGLDAEGVEDAVTIGSSLLTEAGKVGVVGNLKEPDSAELPGREIGGVSPHRRYISERVSE